MGTYLYLQRVCTAHCVTTSLHEIKLFNIFPSFYLCSALVEGNYASLYVLASQCCISIVTVLCMFFMLYSQTLFNVALVANQVNVRRMVYLTIDVRIGMENILKSLEIYKYFRRFHKKLYKYLRFQSKVVIHFCFSIEMLLYPTDIVKFLEYLAYEISRYS